jgi:hypothetical protein
VAHAVDDIAYWLEVAEVRAWTDWYRALAELTGNPFGVSIASDDEAATFSIGSMDAGLFNRCIGLGVGRPATEADVDAAIAAFRIAGRRAWTIQPSPLARPTALEGWLEARDLHRGRQWGKFWRDTETPPEARTDLRIDEVGRDDAAVFDRIVRSSFEMPEGISRTVDVIVGRRDWHVYLAFDGGEPVGAAALLVIGDVGWLGFGGTLTSHRGRGSQSAMFARRIADARALGVRLLITETGEDTTDDPNPSYRNMLRAGFRLGYFRRNWLPGAPVTA